MPKLTAEQEAALRQRYADKTTGEQSGEFLNLQDGEAVVARLLPPITMTDVDYYLEVGKHYGFGEESNQEMIWCPRICKHEECPICEKYFELQKGTSHDKDLSTMCRPSVYFLVDLLILAGPFSAGQPSPELEPGEVRIYNGHTSELEIWHQTTLDPEFGPVWDLAEGVPFTIDCKEGRRPMFQARAKRSAYAVDEAILEMRHNFDEVVVVKPVDEIVAILARTELRPKQYTPRR